MCSACCDSWFLIFDVREDTYKFSSSDRRLHNVESESEPAKIIQKLHTNLRKSLTNHLIFNTCLSYDDEANSECVICFYFKIYNLTLYSVHHPRNSRAGVP